MRRFACFTMVILLAAVLISGQAAHPAQASTQIFVPQGFLSNVSLGSEGEGAGRAQRAANSAQLPSRPSGGRTAASLVPVDSNTSGANSLAQAVFDDGVVGASFVYAPPANGVHAVATDLGGFPANGTGALLTTGDARWATEPDNWQSSGTDAHGTRLINGPHTYDVSVLAIDIDVPDGGNCLSLNFRFYSEEIPEFVRGAYNDGFIAELDRTTWSAQGTTITAPDNFAFDQNGNLVSVNTSGALGMARQDAIGTTYDAATPIMVARTPVTPGRHTLYLSIFDQYDQFYDSAVLVDNARVDHVIDCPTGITEPERPVIFIPGTMGSHLVGPDGSEAWPRWAKSLDSFSDDHLRVLQLKNDGYTNCDSSPECAIRVGEIVRDAPFDVYGSAIRFLQQNGYVLDDDSVPEQGESLFLFPYDWRRAVAANAALLLQRIDQIRAATGADKVNIIAHSQGGQLTRATLGLAGSFGRVNRVVTLGTPVLGAAKALGILRYKNPCLVKVPVAGACVYNRDTISELARNLRGMHDLLPSRRYFDNVGSPVVRTWDSDGDGQPDGAMSVGQVRDLLVATPHSWGVNMPLIDQSFAWHESHDDWQPADPSVGLVRVYGTGLDTIVSLNDERREECDLIWFNCRLVEHHTFNHGSGDGTVPMGSANMNAGPNVATYSVWGIEHDELTQQEVVMNWAVEVVRREGLLGQDVSDPTGFGVTGVVAPSAITSTPKPLEGVELSLTGPATGLLTDADGWRTGVTDTTRGISTADIPGSSYHDANNYSSTLLTKGSAAGRWTATTAGEVRLTLRSYADSVITRAVPYPPVLLDGGAVLTLDPVSVPLAATLPALQVDDNGDGTVDRTIAPMIGVAGTGAADTFGPISTIVVSRYTAGDGSSRAQVTISSTDEGGAGLDRIEWCQIGPNTTGTYTGTLDLPATGTLIVRATDKAGNVEAAYRTVSLEP